MSLPITTWGEWAAIPGALVWGPKNKQMPPPLANGGLYTGQQSTGAWASKPFPATQYAFAAEAANISNIPEVFYHQRVSDNNGADFSPVVHVQPSSSYSSLVIPSSSPAPQNILPTVDMSIRTFTYDANLPVPKNISENDPTHPKNVVRNALVVQNQAVADTKYDISPPPRVEGFAVHQTIGLGSAIVIIGILIFSLLYLKNIVLRVLFIIVVVFLIHYVLVRLEKETVYSLSE